MKNLLFAVSLVVCLCASGGAQKAKIFIDDFVANDGCEVSKDDIQVLHDRIVGNVVSSRKYEVVERKNLATVQKELRIVDAGLTEGASPESNKLKSAGYCVYGKVVQFRSNAFDIGSAMSVEGLVELQLRITNIENGHLLAAKTVKAKVVDTMTKNVVTTKSPRTEAIAKAIDKAAKQVVIKLNDVAFPVYVLSVNSKFVTANVAAEQVTEGEAWEVFELGDELIDPQTGEAMGRDEELVGRVFVARPGAKTTKFSPMSEKDGVAIRKVWEEAAEDTDLPGKKNSTKMVLHKAPEATVKPKVSSGSMPDMSVW